MGDERNVTSGYERWLKERWLASEITSKTHDALTSRLRTLDPICGNLRPCDVDRILIRRWWRSIGRYSPATRRAYLSTVGGFFAWAVTEGLCVENPTEKLPRVREPRRVPRARQTAEVARLLTVASNPRDRLIVWLMVEMGLRCVEVARAELADYDARAGTMLIHGKNDNERTLPVPTPVVDAIKAYRDQIGWRRGALICSRRSSAALDAHWVSKIVTQLLRDADVKHAPMDGITPHSLRHTAASDVLDRCGNVRTVQIMLGHSSLATTQIYLRKASLGQLREAMAGRDYGSS